MQCEKSFHFKIYCALTVDVIYDDRLLSRGIWAQKGRMPFVENVTRIYERKLKVRKKTSKKSE